MSAPIIYRSTDSGITWPPASFSGASSDEKRMLPIYEVLKSCLVEGYAGKAPAGWSMLYDKIATGTGLSFALQNAAKSAVWFFEFEEGYLNLKICDVAPDFDTRLNEWNGDYSAEFNPTGQKQRLSTYYIYAYTYPWVLVANENGCFINLARPGYENGTASYSKGEYFISLYLGASASHPGGMAAPEIGNGIIMGGAYSNGDSRFGCYNATNAMFSFTRNPNNEPMSAPPAYRRYWPGLSYQGSGYTDGEIPEEYALVPIMCVYDSVGAAHTGSYNGHDCL